MKAQARDVHVFDRLSRLKRGEEHPKSFRVVGLDTGRTSSTEEFSQSLVLDGLNHAKS